MMKVNHEKLNILLKLGIAAVVIILIRILLGSYALNK